MTKMDGSLVWTPAVLPIWNSVANLRFLSKLVSKNKLSDCMYNSMILLNGISPLTSSLQYDINNKNP